MKKLITLATFVAFIVAAPAAAQTFGFGAHAGVSVPLGDYGDTDIGAAGFGAFGGLDLWYPLTAVPGLSWYTSADAIAHPADNATVGFGDDTGYLYFPLMTGVRYDIPAGPIGLFATGQLGAVIAMPPVLAGDVSGETSTKFGFNLGAGIQATDYIYGGVKFYPLGDVDWSWEDGTTRTTSVSFFDIYVGFGVW